MSFSDNLTIQNDSHFLNLDHASRAVTESKKMLLNEDKSKIMIFNFTKNFQFSTKILTNDKLLQIIHKTRILGTILSSDLKWHKNTQHLTQKGYQRMTMLRKLYIFDVPQEDLVLMHCLYIRSILEYNSNVWFSSITEEEIEDLERVQHIACKMILKDEYSDDDTALDILNLKSLRDKRKMLAERFANKCQKSEQFSELFPKNDNKSSINNEQYDVKFARKGRLFDSSIPTMQRMLNKQKKK